MTLVKISSQDQEDITVQLFPQTKTYLQIKESNVHLLYTQQELISVQCLLHTAFMTHSIQCQQNQTIQNQSVSLMRINKAKLSHQAYQSLLHMNKVSPLQSYNLQVHCHLHHLVQKVNQEISQIMTIEKSMGKEGTKVIKENQVQEAGQVIEVSKGQWV